MTTPSLPPDRSPAALRQQQLNQVAKGAEEQMAAQGRWNYHNGGNSEPGSQPISLADFRAYMPTHQYLFVPTGQLWPAASVNARLPPVAVNEGKTITATTWLDQYHPVEQMTWLPGHPQLIRDRLFTEGGWGAREGTTCFNLYRPPQIAPGDPAQAGPWIQHLNRIYPGEAAHIAAWFAHRVQHPGEKLNHALVLGGSQGIGKDTLLEPLKYAVGPWNFTDISPGHLLGRFNGFAKSVVLRISETRDLGDVDRYAFYDHTKSYICAPPDVIRCDEKNVREYAVPNVCGVVITTNHKADGLYLPADDRRHYVAWSESAKDHFEPSYWRTLYGWYGSGGLQHVAAYLATYDLADFDPKAPPPKTAAFFDIVDANRAPQDADLADVLDACGAPKALTIPMLADAARIEQRGLFADWLADPRNRRQIPHRLESAGYVRVRNDGAQDGLWKIAKHRLAIYAVSTLPLRNRIAAATELARSGRW